MFATTADELVVAFRAEVNDQAEPYLWADSEVYGYMTEGFDALLKRADVKYQLLSLSFTAGAVSIPLPAKVLHIRAAQINGSAVYPLSAADAAVPRDDYGLRGHTTLHSDDTGNPAAYVRDYDAKALRLQKALADTGVSSHLVRTGDAVGGGSAPAQELTGWAVAIEPGRLSVDELEEKLRLRAKPIVARIHRRQYLLCVRTIREEDFAEIAAAAAETIR